MQQIKFFKGVEADLGLLEKDVNGWLKSNGVRVINIFGNIAPQTARLEIPSGGNSGRVFSASDVFIALLYETK